MTASLTFLFFFLFFFVFLGGVVGYSKHYFGSVEISVISLGLSDSPAKNSGSTVIFTIYFLKSDSCGFKSC